ncbi:MAG: FMN-binding protein [bacterium]|nr:MAG: FMN-binding protein [bacterium]
MLNKSGKKILLSLHIILISIWLGNLISIILMQLSKHYCLVATHFSVVDRLIFILFDSIVMNISIVVAITGLLFSMFTNWGFFKFYWIGIKWFTIFFLAGIIMFFASPAINGMASLSDVFRQECISHPEYLKFEQGTIIYTSLQLTLLVVVIFLSVFKPWGARKQKFKINRKIIIISGIIIGILLAMSSVMQYSQLVHYRSLPVNEIDLSNIDDGYYIGKVDYGFEYEVKVHIKNHKIENIEIIKNRDSFYARLAEGIKHKIIREQKVNIDAVTGATTTSKVLMKAVETAITSNNK